MNQRRAHQVLRRDIPSHLAAAWLGISVLYFAQVRIVPEPLVALGIGTAVGLIVALAGAAMVADRSTVPIRAAQPPESRPDRLHQLPEVVASSNHIDSRAIDFARYPSFDVDETQCPRCGGFEVVRQPIAARGSLFRCAVCESNWQLDMSSPPPDVAVRSWLHRQGV